MAFFVARNDSCTGTRSIRNYWLRIDNYEPKSNESYDGILLLRIRFHAEQDYYHYSLVSRVVAETHMLHWQTFSRTFLITLLCHCDEYLLISDQWDFLPAFLDWRTSASWIPNVLSHVLHIILKFIRILWISFSQVLALYFCCCCCWCCCCASKKKDLFFLISFSFYSHSVLIWINLESSASPLRLNAFTRIILRRSIHSSEIHFWRAWNASTITSSSIFT